MSDQAKTFRYTGKIKDLMNLLELWDKLFATKVVCPECGGTNLNYDKTICWTCQGPN